MILAHTRFAPLDWHLAHLQTASLSLLEALRTSFLPVELKKEYLLGVVNDVCEKIMCIR